MLDEMIEAIRDSQRRMLEPSELSARLGQKAALVFAQLNGVTGPLTMPPPADCPADLAGRIGRHNKAVDVLTQDRQAWVERIGELPLVMLGPIPEPELKAVLEQAGRLGPDAYLLLSRTQELLQGKAELLDDAAALLDQRVVDAQAALQSERDKAERSLRRAGHAAERSDHWAVAPGAAEAQFAQLVNRSENVRAAQARLTDAQALAAQAREQIRTAHGGIVAAGRAKAVCFRSFSAIASL